MPNYNRKWRKRTLSVAMGMSLSLLALSSAQAQSDDGSVVGRTTAGATVTVTSPDDRTDAHVTADARATTAFRSFRSANTASKRARTERASARPWMSSSALAAPRR